MTSDGNKVQQPSQDDLQQRLDDTIKWMWFRELLSRGIPAFRTSLHEHLTRLWPEGTIPRQAEVAVLQQRLRRTQALLLSILETYEGSQTRFRAAVALGVKLGLELPQTILEKAK